MTNITALPGVRLPNSGPNEALVDLLRDLLSRAETGQLQSLIGTGFQSDGLRMGVWADCHSNVYEMLGALAWLQAEYIHRHTGALG